MSLTGYSPGTFAGYVSGAGADAVDCDVRVEVTLSGGRIELSFTAQFPASADPLLQADLARPQAVRIRREIERALQASRPVPAIPLGTFPGTYSVAGEGTATVAVELKLRGGGNHVALVARTERESGAELVIETRLDTEAGVGLEGHLERLTQQL